MELNKEQITLIDHHLQDKDVKYWDIRLEMIDHIVHDVEDKMNNADKNFEDAFKLSLDKWDNSLKSKRNMVTGFANSRPNIIIQKASIIIKKWMYLYVIISFLPFISDRILKIDWHSMLINYHYSFKTIIYILLFFTNTVLIFWYYKIKKNKNEDYI